MNQRHSKTFCLYFVVLAATGVNTSPSIKVNSREHARQRFWQSCPGSLELPCPWRSMQRSQGWKLHCKALSCWRTMAGRRACDLWGQGWTDEPVRASLWRGSPNLQAQPLVLLSFPPGCRCNAICDWQFMDLWGMPRKNCWATTRWQSAFWAEGCWWDSGFVQRKKQQDAKGFKWYVCVCARARQKL